MLSRGITAPVYTKKIQATSGILDGIHSKALNHWYVQAKSVTVYVNNTMVRKGKTSITLLYETKRNVFLKPAATTCITFIVLTALVSFPLISKLLITSVLTTSSLGEN